LVLVTLTRGATAVPHVTQVIDGLPQVIAPQQMIVSCDPAVLPDLCAAALNTVGAIVAVVGVELLVDPLEGTQRGDAIHVAGPRAVGHAVEGVERRVMRAERLGCETAARLHG